MWRQKLPTFDEKVFPDISNAPEWLAEIPLTAWGAVQLEPEIYFPRSAAFLLSIPPENIQYSWTGTSGTFFLEATLAFIQQTLCAVSRSPA